MIRDVFVVLGLQYAPQAPGMVQSIKRAKEQDQMGRGDRKTTKGKRFIRSYGNVRPHRVTAATAVTPKAAVAKKTAASRKKA